MPHRGNLTPNGVFTYMCDAAGRRVRAVSITTTVRYTYTAEGLRTAQDVDGEVTTFAWDWATAVPELLSDDEALYLVGLDTLGWESETDGWMYIAADALGSVRQTVDADEAVVAVREWTPYGEEVGEAQAGLGYAGEWYDPDLGLQYLRARWYVPGTGSFTQHDRWPGVLDRPGTWNGYVYVEGNPVTSVDPSGWDAQTGTEIHAMIESHYIAYYAAGREVRSEYQIAGASKQGLSYRRLPDGTIELIGQGTGQPGFADLADLTYKQLYEIKPIAAEQQGVAELYWYLSFLQGWTPGAVYPTEPTYIGPWPSSQGDQSVYAQMRVPGVIVYWAKNTSQPVPVPVPIPERDKDKVRDWLRARGLKPAVVQTCTVVVAVGVTVIIIVDGIPGDEVLVPVLWSTMIP